jgi:hypothetical protein
VSVHTETQAAGLTLCTIDYSALPTGKLIVVILADSGERYLTSALFAGRFSESETVQATVN